MFPHTPLGPGLRGCFWVMCSVLFAFVICFFAVHHCWWKLISEHNNYCFRGFSSMPFVVFCAVPWILRVLKWRQVNNQSPEQEHQPCSRSSRCSQSWSPVVEHVHDQTTRERSLDRCDQQGSSQSSNDPPDCAKELLLEQKEYERSLKDWKRNLLQNLIRLESMRRLNLNLNSY